MRVLAHRVYRRLIYLGALILLLVAMLWCISRYYEPILRREIRVAIQQSTKGLYDADFERINTNILFGNVLIRNFQLQPNRKVYNMLVQAHKAPDNLYEVKVEALKIRGVHLYNLLANRRLVINKIKLDASQIMMYHRSCPYNQKQALKPHKNLYQLLATYLSEMTVKSVEMADVHFNYIDRDSTHKNMHVAHLNVHLFDWELTASSHLEKDRFYYFKDAIFTLPSYHFTAKNGLYAGEWQNISLLYKEKKVTISSFEMHPTVNIDQFQQRLGYRRLSVTTLFKDVKMDGVDMTALLRRGELKMHQLSVNSGVLKLKNGKNIVNNTIDKAKVVPHELLQKIPLPIKIDSAIFTQIDASYEEYNQKSRKSGTISFDNTKCVMSSVTNMLSDKPVARPDMTVDLETQLMGKAPFRFHLNMIYDAPLGDFSIKGHLGAINARVFNQITIPLGLLTIRSLDVHSMDFRMKGDNIRLDGQMQFIYNNLSVSLMHRNEQSGVLHRKGLLSILANKWVLENENPRLNGGALVIAPIHFERPKSFTFSKFVWKALLGGIKYSVGLTPEKEIEIKNKIDDLKRFKNQFQSYKDQLKKIRQNRDLRRKQYTER